jgi:homoserine O-acetyltransferase/O-succinyltransferase
MRTGHISCHCFFLIASVLVFPGFAAAYDDLVEKRVFMLPSFTTRNGSVLIDVRFGYETYGNLNSNKDNAILILPAFASTGHVAGKFAETDQQPGYWDSIIGSGKPIDTDKYFVIAGDGLINIRVRDGHTVTTGPASIDPNTGKPYAMRFPLLTIRDLVDAQKALVDSLGIHKLHAVMGQSMGGMQSFEWATVFPDSTDRVIPVVALAEEDGYGIEYLDAVSTPIKLDPNWSQGDYYGKAEPLDGLTGSFKILIHAVRSYGIVSRTVDRKWAQEDKDPARDWSNNFEAASALEKRASFLAKTSDANSFLYEAKAMQSFVAGDGPTLDTGLASVKARLLILPAQSDLLVYPKYSQDAAEHLKRLGKSVEYHEIPGDGGHLDGMFSIAAVGNFVSNFLSH